MNKSIHLQPDGLVLSSVFFLWVFKKWKRFHSIHTDSICSFEVCAHLCVNERTNGQTNKRIDKIKNVNETERLAAFCSMATNFDISQTAHRHFYSCSRKHIHTHMPLPSMRHNCQTHYSAFTRSLAMATRVQARQLDVAQSICMGHTYMNTWPEHKWWHVAIVHYT